MFEQSYTFTFEAAHELSANVEEIEGHPYANIHGHSFAVTVTLEAGALSKKGWVLDYASLRTKCDAVRARLDHQFLNHVPGLERPTLERLAKWIFELLADDLPTLANVEVARPSLRERVKYRR